VHCHFAFFHGINLSIDNRMETIKIMKYCLLLFPIQRPVLNPKPVIPKCNYHTPDSYTIMEEKEENKPYHFNVGVWRLFYNFYSRIKFYGVSTSNKIIQFVETILG